MRAAGKVCLVVLLATGLIAQTESAKPKKAKAAPITAADVQALRDAIAAQQAAIQQQQQEIQALRDELHHKDAAVQQAQTAASDAASKADAAEVSSSRHQDQATALRRDASDPEIARLDT